MSDVKRTNEIRIVGDLLDGISRRLKDAMADVEIIQRRVERIRDSQKEADTDALKALACWMGGSDTGLSSMAIAVATLTGAPGKGFPPSDTSDFGRCYRLLKAHPMCAEGLAVLGKQGSPVWRGLVANWDELTTLYEAIGYEAAGMEAPRRARYGQPESPERIAYTARCEAMYLRMKQIIREAQHPLRRVEEASPLAAQGEDSGFYVLERRVGVDVAWLAGRDVPYRRWVTQQRDAALIFCKSHAEREMARVGETTALRGWKIVPYVPIGAPPQVTEALDPDAMMKGAVIQTVEEKSEQQQGDAA